MPHILPSDWQDVLHRVHGWLEDSTSRAESREQAFLLRFADEPSETDRVGILSSLEQRLRELPALMGPITAQASAADKEAKATELALRDLTQRSESLRLQLADWVGRS